MDMHQIGRPAMNMITAWSWAIVTELQQKMSLKKSVAVMVLLMELMAIHESFSYFGIEKEKLLKSWMSFWMVLDMFGVGVA